MLKKNNDAQTLIEQFEQMVAHNAVTWLDSRQFETLIEHYRAAGDYSKALKANQVALHQHPYSFEFFILQAEIQMELGMFEDALETVERVENFQPNDSEILQLKADLYMFLGQPERALTLLESLAESAETSYEIILKLAHANLVLGQYASAIAYYEDLLRNFPEFEEFEAVALDILECYEVTHSRDTLIAFLEQLVNEAPYSALRWYQMGYLCNLAGLQAKAQEAFEYAVLLEDDFADAWFHKGHAHMNNNEYEKAAEAYLQVLKIEDEEGDAELFCHLAAAYEKHGNLPLAVSYYRKALEDDEEFSDAWFGWGMCMLQQERWLQAVHFFKKATRLNAYVPEYWLFLGKAEYNLGSLVACEEAFEKAAALAPYLSDIWLTWSKLHYDEGELEQAIDIIENGLEENPDDAELMYRAVLYYFAAGHMQKSLRQLEFALLLDHDAHEQLYTFFPDVAVQKRLFQMVNLLRKDLF